MPRGSGRGGKGYDRKDAFHAKAKREGLASRAAYKLEEIQRDLFAIGGHLATPDPAKVAKALAKASLSPARVEAFERMMDEADAELPPLRAFVLPGGTPKSAAFHVARTVCRRAERTVVTLSREAEVPELFLAYLNRLSDLLFILARHANREVGDVLWVPGGERTKP